MLIKPAAVKGKSGETAVDRIGNELIVTLKAGSDQSIEDLAQALDAKIMGQADDLKTYRLRFEDEEAAGRARALLEKDPDVAGVENNHAVDRPLQPEFLAASSSTFPPLKPKSTSQTGQVIVGLIDSSVQGQNSPVKDFLLPTISLAGAVEAGGKEITHGTSMAETILRGMTFGTSDPSGSPVRILPVDVYGQSPQTTTFDVARGIYAAVQAGANIVNLSLGSEADSPFLKKIIAEAHQKGVMFVSAAGNEPVTTPSYPAAYTEVVAVTAGDKAGKIAAYANRGDFIDVIAPGASIVHFNNQSYFGMGTSYSAAYVSGLAAGLASSLNKPALQVEGDIRRDLGVAAPSRKRP